MREQGTTGVRAFFFFPVRWGWVIALGTYPGLAGTIQVVESAEAQARPCGPVWCQPATPLDEHASDALMIATGRKLPMQSDQRGRLCWWGEPLDAGKTRTYSLESCDNCAAQDEVRVRQHPDELIVVTIAGRPFTEMHFGPTDPKPYLYPVIGPTGDPVTRDFPMKNTDIEANNHPNRQDERHHRSLWTAHGDVRTTDFNSRGSNHWNDALQKGDAPQRVRRILHLASGPVFGQISADIDWVTNQGRHELTETRSYTFYRGDESTRMIDVRIVLDFDAGDVMFADSKEAGIIAMRLAVTMDEIGAAGQHGQMRNANGKMGEKECWGERANWCDYVGPVRGHTVGIAIMDAPANFRHPTPWHVRGYGLFAANPFGLSAYTNKRENGSMTWKKGEKVEFNYRILIHREDTQAARVADQYELYANPPRVMVSAVTGSMSRPSS